MSLVEMGHIVVPRHEDDDYRGHCPFHESCWEGMVAGPALEDRFGSPAEALEGSDRDHAVRLAGWYVAAGLRSIVYTLAPQRIILGGGVATLSGLIPEVRRRLAEFLGGYPGLPEHGSVDFVVPAGLGAMAGPAGALVLAELELARS